MVPVGWSEVPDPERRLAGRVQIKLYHMRRKIAHGRDPLGGRDQAQVSAPGTYNWRAWLRRAFETLPDKTGTSSDVAAALEADPEVAPKLDHRHPEFVDTGLKRGKLKVYRYDEQLAQASGDRCRKRNC
ncbi:hypothetical protein GPECTOR_87g427 [Gonium pectorale]|uniref:Uncharacterized protein n=1 Tax=Gonium pectorale TaxID=33097 RepID=A0A150G149_GONPE|nr:hypothetical protein GPECTOR_87g427 [Gonium pectorale]|eukprot:KXZ43564.1 hypothetical protein GPECTOR_87g427 [Gonium pectorale]